MEKTPTGLQKFDIKVSWSRQKVIMLYYNSCFFTMSVFCRRISSLFPLPLVFRAAYDNGTLQFSITFFLKPTPANFFDERREFRQDWIQSISAKMKRILLG